VLSEQLPSEPKPGVSVGVLEEEIFADYIVSSDEYERAILATIRCIRDQGFAVDGPLRYPDGPLVLSPGEDPTVRLTWQYANIKDDTALQLVEDECRMQWSLRIERVWIGKHAPTESEVQAWLEKAWACAREKGLLLSEPPTEDDALSSTSYGCRPWEETG
jgi:hypothetical protein